MLIQPNSISPARRLTRQYIGQALKAGARTRKEINAFNPFAAKRGYEYECWRSEVSTWFGGKGGVKGDMLEQSAVSIMHFAGKRLEFGRGAVEQMLEWVASRSCS